VGCSRASRPARPWSPPPPPPFLAPQTPPRASQKINAKLHDGVCQRCKEVLEWRVKYSKYKPLSKPKKCVKCLQKTVKDSYHIMCRPCACELDVCAKCGKKEDIVIPFNKETEKTENFENNLCSNHQRSCRRNEESDDDLDFDIDLDDAEDGNQAD
uniref:Chromosome 9 open reading frame 85 n=1 Tax=Equus asinus TaxID=9793 RepID=A0A9L0JYF6_EQUAS